MDVPPRESAELLVRAVAFVDDGVCPLIGLCVVLYPIAGAVWAKSKTHERTSLYAGSSVLVLYTTISLAVAPTMDANLALVIAIRAIIAAVAAALLAAILTALVQAFALNPARRIALSVERTRQQRRAERTRKEAEALNRQREIEARQRSLQLGHSEQHVRAARDAEEARRHAAARVKNTALYEFKLRYVAARPHLTERLSETEFEALLQTTLEPSDPVELETRKAALSQLMDSFSQEAIAREPPKSVEQLLAVYRRRHDEIDAASFADDMKEKMHRWLNKEESQAISRFMMMRYD